MKASTSRLTLAAVIALAVGGVTLAGPAASFTAYQLDDDSWAIRCNDGVLFSYSGSSAGLDIVGPALCEGHGGVVGDDGTGGDTLTVTPVSAELRRMFDRCTAAAGAQPTRKVDGAMRCPGRAAPSHNSSRSNVRG